MAYDPNDAADKAVFDAAVAEATEGLVTKRDQLLGEVKTLKAKITKGAADPEAMDRLQTQLDEATGKLETTSAELKTANTKLGKVTKDYESETGYAKKLLVDNGLTGALTSAKVAAQFLPAVTAMFAGKVEVKPDGGERKLFIGDKPLAEAITAWSQSDEGKHYVTAGNNGGGGANGGAGGNANSKTMSRSAFDALPHSERNAFISGGGVPTEG